jgi:addiction module RelE/StbE family toxin
MQVVWTLDALDDLKHLRDYIRLDNPDAAEEIAKKILEVVSKLRDYPSLGKAGRIVGTREMAISGTPYVLPYKVIQDSLVIIRVLHGSRQWPCSI